MARRNDQGRFRQASIRLLDRAMAVARVLDGHESESSPLQEHIGQLIRDWEHDTPQVALLGAFSAGKSTLLNRLIGNKDLLPATRTPTTAVVTVVRYGPRLRGTLIFRTCVRVSLGLKDNRSKDTEAVAALLRWAGNPERYGVRRAREVRGTGLVEADLAQLRAELLGMLAGDPDGRKPRFEDGLTRTVVGRAVPPEQLARTFEVEFLPREPLTFDLSRSEERERFRACMTSSEWALQVERAVCQVPEDRLRGLNWLDTAGLCSPTRFHTAITEALLARHPDALVVVINARRFAFDTTEETVAAVARFVSQPSDYDRVIFALTFWDEALRNEMEQDLDDPIVFLDTDAQRITSDRLVRSLGTKLRRMAAKYTGCEPEGEIQAIPLALTDDPPAAVRGNLDALLSRLEQRCAGWIGVQMWAERWRAASNLGQRLELRAAEVSEQIEADLVRAAGEADVAEESARLDRQVAMVQEAVTRRRQGVLDTVAQQLQVMLTDIDLLSDRKAIMKFLDGGYVKSATGALDALEAQAKVHKESLARVFNPETAQAAMTDLPDIHLDRKVLGLNETKRVEARKKISGTAYWLKRIWDTPFRGILELSASHREAARAVVRGEVRETFQFFRGAALDWGMAIDLASAKVERRVGEQRRQLLERQRDRKGLLDRLRLRQKEVSQGIVAAQDVAAEICKQVADLEGAQANRNARRVRADEALM